MERVQTLTNKLNEQLARGASVAELLLTVQMLQSELAHLQSYDPAQIKAPVTIDIAPVFVQPAQQAGSLPAEPVSEPLKAVQPAEEEKIVEVLQIDEAEVEAELDEIKRIAEERNKITAQNKPSLHFDPVEDIPTLTHQQTNEEVKKPQELNQSIATDIGSLNDRLKQTKLELSDALQDSPIKDLKKGIGINDRFLFIKELFRGDETMYERSIKTINGFSIFPEAEYWIKRELKLKLGWDDRNETVRQFDQLVRRRFS